MKRAILLLLLISAPVGAQTLSDNGLETANYKYVAVMVEGLSADARSTGLTEDGIRTRVERRLRSAGLTAGDDVNRNFTYLYVNLNAVGVGFGINLQYRREVVFETGGQPFSVNPGVTWWGNAGGSEGVQRGIIMDGLDGLLDQFLNDDYLKANQK